MTTILNDTNISRLLEVSNGNFAALEKMTEELRQRVQGQLSTRAATTSSSSDAGRSVATPGKP